MCLNDGTCLGLYKQLSNKKVCYQVGSINTCSTEDKVPLLCTAVVTTTTAMPDPCISWCDEVGDCENSPAGSFCQENGTCHGLYDRIGQSRCYAFFGEGCGLATPLIPVSCGVYTTTTVEPSVSKAEASKPTPSPLSPEVQGEKLIAPNQEDALKWYIEQLAEFHKQRRSNQTPSNKPSADELGVQRWDQQVAPSAVRKSDTCDTYCKSSDACFVTGSTCEEGVCSNLFINRVGKVCYKSHLRACPVTEFVPVVC